ncbi:MutS family DNA mismatch repair protein [Croceitalea sp. MTPC9]|uniref:MutS-related protein n=1 Tax=unclassified Croceitalea TaxID=2632280 RepID=UPI002B369836|nr:MutS family DNA mismatch repair protein [Croceitalea sp. MTPC6]GMN17641.1 MutS family DNA mismatch repair protein [Croceitalea sp. MTPC9]
MQKLFEFYIKNLERYTSEGLKIQKRLKILSYSRLAMFAATIIAVYFLWFDVKLATLSAFLGMGTFLFLVRYYEDVKQKYRFTHALTKINSTELDVLKYDFDTLPDGAEFIDANHDYSQDLDLFGKGSFFQYMNRTQLDDGTNYLSELINSNNVESIIAKQETVDELARKPEWRQNYTAKAMLIKSESTTKEIVNWLNKHTPFVPKVMRYLPWLFLGVTIALCALLFLASWSFSLFIFWIVLGLGITARYYRQISLLARRADKVKAVFKQYSKLMAYIEETNFDGAQLKYQKQKLLVGDKNASATVKEFGKLLDVMDYNNNVFYAIFGNGCFLGALRTAYQIETWIKKHKDNVPDWFEVIAFFDAYNSLGNFSFNHPLYTYPIVQEGRVSLACKKAGHAMIPADKNIRNDFQIGQENFFIITGSNMAGKSTFLRTVGLAIVIANMGLPVCAEECFYSPIKLMTSMRSIDSLTKGDSFFLSELKRLRKIVTALKSERYFVLLDEILKGTNSMDKASGSKKFLARLVKERATGLIATHDLSLCSSAKDFKQIHNYYLDASIENDELYFDYLLKRGVSKTMNASFLLEKMDIV